MTDDGIDYENYFDDVKGDLNESMDQIESNIGLIRKILKVAAPQCEEAASLFSHLKIAKDILHEVFIKIDELVSKNA